MSLSKIKAQYAGTFVAFGKSALPLGQNPQIDELAIMAHKSNSPVLKAYFEVLPPLEELQQQHTEAKLNAIMPERIQQVKPSTDAATGNTDNSQKPQQSVTQENKAKE